MDTLRLLDRTRERGGRPDVLDDLLQGAGQGHGVLRIRCPRCRWRPRRDSRWVCTPGCGFRWNTFDTRGRCPACDHQWNETQCLSCKRFSPHEDWYEAPDVPA